MDVRKKSKQYALLTKINYFWSDINEGAIWCGNTFSYHVWILLSALSSAKISSGWCCFQSSWHMGQFNIIQQAGNIQGMAKWQLPHPALALCTTSREMVSSTWSFRLNCYFKAVYKLAKTILTHEDSLSPMRIWFVHPRTDTSGSRILAHWSLLQMENNI